VTHEPMLPPVFDLEYYIRNNPDLNHINGAKLIEHFQTFGIKEGRSGSPGCYRDILIGCVKKEQIVLEIGPFASPAIKGKNVLYLDAYSQEELKDRCRLHGLNPENVPNIDFVINDSNFENINIKFDAIFSSHSIEHQIDFVGHLKSVSSILKDGGRYYVISPDKRYCFDHFRPSSTIGDVIGAALNKQNRHDVKTVANHFLLQTHNDAVLHWAGDHGSPSYILNTSNLLQDIKNIDFKHTYVDAHAWQLTPSVFYDLSNYLFMTGEIDMYPERVYNTPFNHFEFMVILKKGMPDDTPSYIREIKPF
jgi:hypothetical protein